MIECYHRIRHIYYPHAADMSPMPLYCTREVEDLWYLSNCATYTSRDAVTQAWQPHFFGLDLLYYLPLTGVWTRNTNSLMGTYVCTCVRFKASRQMRTLNAFKESVRFTNVYSIWNEKHLSFLNILEIITTKFTYYYFYQIPICIKT